jgi:hypothetical protein
MGSNGDMDSKPNAGTREQTDFSANSGVEYPDRAMPKVTGLKADKIPNATMSRSPMGPDASDPDEGTRSLSSWPEDSEVVYPERKYPAVQDVKQAKENPGVISKSRGYTKRSEDGNANKKGGE